MKEKKYTFKESSLSVMDKHIRKYLYKLYKDNSFNTQYLIIKIKQSRIVSKGIL